MILTLFSAPAALLCLYLAWHCWRHRFYRQGLGLLTAGLALLLITLGILAAGRMSADLLTGG